MYINKLASQIVAAAGEGRGDDLEELVVELSGEIGVDPPRVVVDRTGSARDQVDVNFCRMCDLFVTCSELLASDARASAGNLQLEMLNGP